MQPQFKIPPEMIVKALMQRAREQDPRPSIGDKSKAMKVVCEATSSLPVLTIATRDRVEELMAARRRADEHRAAYVEGLVDTVSPETLDS